MLAHEPSGVRRLLRRDCQPLSLVHATPALEPPVRAAVRRRLPAPPGTPATCRSTMRSPKRSSDELIVAAVRAGCPPRLPPLSRASSCSRPGTPELRGRRSSCTYRGRRLMPCGSCRDRDRQPDTDELCLRATSSAFHTARWRDNFAACCVESILERRCGEDGAVRVGSRSVHLSARPISVSPAELRASAASGRRRARQAALGLAAKRRSQLIVRVDRADPSKNVVRGFEAFELLLETRIRNTASRVSECSRLLNPSREDVPAYVEYRESDRNGSGHASQCTLRVGGVDAGLPRCR